MLDKSGISVSTGISIGRAYIYKDYGLNKKRMKIDNKNREILKLEKAIDKCILELENLYKKSLPYIGRSKSEVFLAHKAIVEDPKFKIRIEELILDKGINSEWALSIVIDNYIDRFKAIDNKYLEERILDIQDIYNRMIKNLSNINTYEELLIPKNSIILAKELTPSELIEINKAKIKGLVLENGSLTSHTSIIAKTLGVPVIINVKGLFNNIEKIDKLIIDGYRARIIINPDRAIKKEYEKIKEEEERLKLNTKKYKKKDALTKDGKSICIKGNIAGISDAREILENGGDGVGLFRTEFLYINKEKAPSELEQIQVYSQLAELFINSKINIRTADIGGDKGVPYLNLSKEQNPFLGYRGIRVSLDNKDMFKTQIRAILRSNKYGNFRILFPMVSSITELELALEIIEDVKIELKEEGVFYNPNVEIGIVAETPAVVLQADSFAKRVDFMSIGSNDLIQYTVAVDRDNLIISDLYNPYHPSILKSIKILSDSCKKYNTRLSICGEIGSEEKLIPILLAMGITELSITPNKILSVKRLIRSIDLDKIKNRLDKILNLEKAKDVENTLESIYEELAI